MEGKESFLRTLAEIVTPLNAPPPRFGHTVNLVSKTTVVVFGGAISSPGNYTMTADLYLYNMALNSWKKLDRKNNF
jgi:protein phosphatase